MRHRREDHPRHAGEREQGEEGHGDDQHREEHGRADLRGRRPHALLDRPSARAAQVPVDVLDHDDGRIDDDSEIDRAQRDEVRGRPGGDHPAEGREQGERDVHCRQRGRAGLTEEHPEHQRDQRHADEQVLDHRARGQVHQLLAVVVRLDGHAGREQVVLADLLDLVVHPGQRLERVAAVAHQHDALHHVGLDVLAHDAEARSGAFPHLGQVAHAHRHALLLGDDDLSHVLERLDETDAAHVERLFAQREPLAAHVLVGVGDAGRELLERETVPLEPHGIDVDVDLAGLAAEADNVDDARHLAELALEDPILRGLELRQRRPRPAQDVAVDLADRIPGRELGLHPLRELDELQPVDDPLLRLDVGRVPVEIALHVGESEERLRADVVQVDHARKAALQWEGDGALHLLGGEALRLRDHLDHRRHRVGVRLDVELRVAVEADAQERQREGQDQSGEAQRRGHQPFHHSVPESSSEPEETTCSPRVSPSSTTTGSASSASTCTRRCWKRSRPFSLRPICTSTTVWSPR